MNGLVEKGTRIEEGSEYKEKAGNANKSEGREEVQTDAGSSLAG